MRHQDFEESMALSFREDTNFANKLNFEAVDLMLRSTPESCPGPSQPAQQSLVELANAKSNRYRNEDNTPYITPGSVIPLVGAQQESPGDRSPTPAPNSVQFESQVMQKIDAPEKPMKQAADVKPSLLEITREMEDHGKAIKQVDELMHSSMRSEYLRLQKRLESGIPMKPEEMRVEAARLKEITKDSVKVRLDYYCRLRKLIELHGDEAERKDERILSAYAPLANKQCMTKELHKLIREISDLHPNAHDDPQFAKDAKQAGVLRPSKK